MRSRLCVVLVALAAAVSLAACGGGGESSDTGGGATTTPTTKEQAIERCREEAARLTGDNRKTAEAACEAGESGDTTEVMDAVREQCLNAAKDIANPAAKKAAEDACKQHSQ